MLRRVFRPKKDDVAGVWCEELCSLYSALYVISVI